MPHPLLDTDALLEITEGDDPYFEKKGARYKAEHGRLRFSILTRYEVLKGLYYTDPPHGLGEFQALCADSEVLPLSEAAVRRAAEVYGFLRRNGMKIPDQDVLIGATALTVEAPIITCDISHFRRIPDLQVIDWSRP